MVIVAFQISKRLSMSDKTKNCIKKAQRLVLYNPIIRYFLLNVLKFNLIAMVIMAGLRRDDKQLIIAIPLFLVINAMPLLFTWCINKNKTKLQRKSLKKKIGTLYSGLKIRFYHMEQNQNVSKLVILYPMIFVYRRTLFALITVFMYKVPNLQFCAHYFTSLLYLSYLCQDRLF